MFNKTTDNQINLGLLVSRLVVGTIFVAHGSQKIFTMGLNGVAGGFGQMGIPMAEIAGPAIALLEFFGGFAIIAGLLTRLVSLGLAGTMVGAIAFVHAKNGFFAPSGIEFVLSLLGSSLMLAITGAGSLSVDGLIGSRNRKTAPVTAEVAKIKRAA